MWEWAPSLSPLFTVTQPTAQSLSWLWGPQCPSAPGLCLQSTSCTVLEVHHLGATHTPPSRFCCLRCQGLSDSLQGSLATPLIYVFLGTADSLSPAALCRGVHLTRRELVRSIGQGYHHGCSSGHRCVPLGWWACVHGFLHHCCQSFRHEHADYNAAAAGAGMRVSGLGG